MNKKSFFFLFVILIIIAPFITIASIQDRLSGKILLQVESKGEAWYVNPINGKRHYLGRPEDAFKIMREQGLGITNASLAKIPPAIDFINGFENFDSDNDGYNDKEEMVAGYNPYGPGKLIYDISFTNQQKGKILLQVESHGEAWYVNPTDSKRYYLGRPFDAFTIMKKTGLGIKNSDLEKIYSTETTTDIFIDIPVNILTNTRINTLIDTPTSTLVDNFTETPNDTLTDQEKLKNKITSWINEGVVNIDGITSIKDVVDQGDLYKVTEINVNGSESVSYLTKDEKIYCYSYRGINSGVTLGTKLTINQVKIFLSSFIDQISASTGYIVNLEKTTEEEYLFKGVYTVQGQEKIAYLTKDGRILFLSYINIEEQLKK